jgi:branched-chain amino acid transport system substrate-binding protein
MINHPTNAATMNTPWNPRPQPHRAVVVAACIALAVAVAACGGGGGEDGPGSKQLDLVIGNVLPLSGPSEQLGQSGEKASRLALAQINSAIEDTGADHHVRAIKRDEGADAGTASEAATTLTEDGAGCLTGPWSTAAVEQTANDVAIPRETLEIAPVPATEAVTELRDHDLVNSTALPVSIEGTALADAIERDLRGAEGRTVDLAASDDAYGETLAQDFTEEWQDREGTVVQPATGGSPDATLLIGDPSGFSELVSSVFGWNPTIAWGSDQLVNPGLPGQVRDLPVTGMRAVAPAHTEQEASFTFGREFKSAQPHDVQREPYAAQEFDATVLCYLAAVAAGSTDPQQMADELIDITAPGGERFNWQQLPDAIDALEKGEDIDYTGASGPIDMDVHGNPTSGVFDVYRYAANGLEVVGEVSVEKPNPATP